MTRQRPENAPRRQKGQRSRSAKKANQGCPGRKEHVKASEVVLQSFSKVGSDSENYNVSSPSNLTGADRTKPSKAKRTQDGKKFRITSTSNYMPTQVASSNKKSLRSGDYHEKGSQDQDSRELTELDENVMRPVGLPDKTPPAEQLTNSGGLGTGPRKSTGHDFVLLIAKEDGTIQPD